MILILKSIKTKMLKNYKGKYFSMSELLHSDIAVKYGIDNEPTYIQLMALRRLIDDVLDPIREMYGAPLHINSGFRCEQLNIHPKIKGAKNSQHTKGEAADLDTRKGQKENLKLLNMIRKSSIDYDQLILEDSDHDGLPNWVHVSRRLEGPQRNQFINLKV